MECQSFNIYKHTMTNTGVFTTQKYSASPCEDNENVLLVNNGNDYIYLERRDIDSDRITCSADEQEMYYYSKTSDPIMFLDMLKNIIVNDVRALEHKLAEKTELLFSIDDAKNKQAKEQKGIERV